MAIGPVGAEFFHAEGTERHMMKPAVPFKHLEKLLLIFRGQCVVVMITLPTATQATG